MDISIPESSKKRGHFLRWGLALFLVIGVIGIAWMWMRYQAIKDLPQVKTQIEKIKDIWNDTINVVDKEIRPEFLDLKLLTARDDVYRVVGKEHTREFVTEIPQVKGILIERHVRF